MDEDQIEEIDTSVAAIETEVISHANPVLTLITTEDGIPTSTEVTVLTTALGDVPLMTATLGTLSEVPLVTTHPTFVTSHHHGVGTVYTASISQGQPMVVGEGQITVLDNDGSQQTIVVHADPSQLSALAQVQNSGSQPHLINVSFHEATSPSVHIGRHSTTLVPEQIDIRHTEVIAPENQRNASIVDIMRQVHETTFRETEVEPGLGVSCAVQLKAENREVSKTVDQFSNVCTSVVEKPLVEEVSNNDSQIKSLSPVPEEVVCLLCYQAFINPKCHRKVDESIDFHEHSTSNQISKCGDPKSGNTFYGRTLAKFFEISRINMSIVTRRSYKDYVVPICQTCNANLVKAEQILEQLRQLERELYYIRQHIKEDIMASYEFYKNQENRELAETRKNIPGLAEIVDIIDRIREDIVNDGRPPKIPKSVSRGSKQARKPKQKNTAESTTDLKPSDAASSEKVGNEEDKSQTTSLDHTSEIEKSETKTAETEGDDKTKAKNTVRTSFGRVVKRPTYMVNELTEDELSDLGESSEDNYEEIEIKPELPPVGEAGEHIEDDFDEEDPAWSPGRGMFISERVGIPPSSSDESNYSEEDSEGETTQKVKIKKEAKDKKSRRSKSNKNKKTIKRVPVIKQEDMNYEVKVIQLDGTELMTINASGADDKIGLQPDITQKVMDSQAVIMVKNQLFGKRVQCPHCTRTFTDPHRRDIHVKKKHEGVSKPFECEACQKRFSRQDHLKNHMKRHLRPPREKVYKPKTPSTEKNQACEYCEQRFRNKSELAVHIRTHTGERPYKCEHCVESFVSILKREFHIEQMHPHVPPLRCEHCPKAFFRQHRLRIHTVTHTGEKANICELCGKSFSQAAMLRYHQTTHEELNLKQFKCQECNRVFANPQNLKSHMESQHQKMYRHPCPHCDKGYTQMSHLRRHLRTHTGETPYSCPHCPKAFTSGAALKIHVRIHTHERPYRCSLCDKSFRSKTKLSRHLKTLIHTGEKERIKKETVTAEIETPVEMSVAPSTAWTEIVGIITGV